jgi:hypothetical protein
MDSMIRGDATEAEQIEAVMLVHGVDEDRARFILAIERREIGGDVMPEIVNQHQRRRLGLSHPIESEDE